MNTHIPHTYLIETVTESTTAFSGDFLQVIKDQVTLPDNSSASREWIDFGRASAIIALTHDNQIVLEHQYRHPVNKTLIEIPAGKSEKKEKPLDCAKRELLEETGFVTNKWQKLGTCLPCIGYSNEEITYFLAEDISYTRQNLDTGEFLEVFTLPLEEFFTLIYKNIITDSKTITGAMLYLGYKHFSST